MIHFDKFTIVQYPNGYGLSVHTLDFMYPCKCLSLNHQENETKKNHELAQRRFHSLDEVIAEIKKLQHNIR